MDVKLKTYKTPARGSAELRLDRTEALKRAMFVEWAEFGYCALTVDGIARRAGVGKAAIYRRWPSKVQMVADVLAEVAEPFAIVPAHNSLEDDVRATLLELRILLRHNIIRRIIAEMLSEQYRSEELGAVLLAFRTRRRARVEAMIRRAVARGELPAEVDVGSATDLIPSLIYWRMIAVNSRVDRAYIDRTTAIIIAGMRAAVGPMR